MEIFIYYQTPTNTYWMYQRYLDWRNDYNIEPQCDIVNEQPCQPHQIMNILFICTSNNDRSPALEKYYREKYPEHKYKRAGINKYFTTKKRNSLFITRRFRLV